LSAALLGRAIVIVKESAALLADPEWHGQEYLPEKFGRV
jgi:hypothetical protein